MVWEVEKGKKIPCNNHRVPWQGWAAKARLWSRIALVKTSCLFISSQTISHFLFLNNQQMLTIPNRQVGSIPSSVWWGFLFIGAIFSRRRRPANSFMEPSPWMEQPPTHRSLTQLALNPKTTWDHPVLNLENYRHNCFYFLVGCRSCIILHYGMKSSSWS